MHAITLMPELVRLGKSVVIGSYSFGAPEDITGEDAQVVFNQGGAAAVRVTARCRGSAHYAPEVHVCSYLDKQYPQHAPHSVYAYYARDFTVTRLHRSGLRVWC